MIAIPLIAGASAIPVAIKAIGEIHRITVLQSNVLARQGLSTPDELGKEERESRKRGAGFGGDIKSKTPSYMKKVPKKAVAGDLRKKYEVGGLGNALSSRGNLTDILAKVPRKISGTEQYKRINRPPPKRLPGYGNQSFTP